MLTEPVVCQHHEIRIKTYFQFNLYIGLEVFILSSFDKISGKNGLEPGYVNSMSTRHPLKPLTFTAELVLKFNDSALEKELVSRYISYPLSHARNGILRQICLIGGVDLSR